MDNLRINYFFIKVVWTVPVHEEISNKIKWLLKCWITLRLTTDKHGNHVNVVKVFLWSFKFYEVLI